MTRHVSLNDLKPEDDSHLSTLSNLVLKSKKCVIITGAGISCNAGIPVHHLESVSLTSGFSF